MSICARKISGKSSPATSKSSPVDVKSLDQSDSSVQVTNVTHVSFLREWCEHSSLSFHSNYLIDKGLADQVRRLLLDWYHRDRRRLPWRGDPPPWTSSAAKTIPVSQRQGTLDSFVKKSRATCPPEQDNKAFLVSAYGVWVSEIMLQQTRVETVVPYWTRWMRDFPTVQALADATPEEVNAHWAGLGFYRRARLLHQAAQKVASEFGGRVPDSVEGLLSLPGIGRYTAHAIASIAYQVPVPVVDGNVCRVLSRLCGIAQHVKARSLKDVYGWELVQTIVGDDGETAGDVNQALMELGATYCSPSGTGVEANDPLRGLYRSVTLGSQVAQLQATDPQELELLLQQTSEHTSECPVCASDGLHVALTDMKEQLTASTAGQKPLTLAIGHRALPIAPPQTTKREQVLVVAVLHCDDFWLLVKRPPRGLLAGQWEFPAICVWDSVDAKQKGMTKKIGVPTIKRSTRQARLTEMLREQSNEASGIHMAKRKAATAALEHVFSHVRHTMWVEAAEYQGSFGNRTWVDQHGKEWKWMTREEMTGVGITSGVRKVLKQCVQECSASRKRKKSDSDA